MSYRIVIVEDDPAMVEVLTAVLGRAFEAVHVVGSGFDSAAETIRNVMPDVVVLDIFDDQLNAIAVQPAFEYVWNTHFCPVIFHSAHDIEEYKNLGHPFVRFEIKGMDSQSRVVDHIKSFEQEINGLRNVRRELSSHAGEIMRHNADFFRTSNNPTSDQTDLFLRVVRRRMAAALDEIVEHQAPINAWEQYIYPPVCNELLTGDILRVTSEPFSKVEAHRVVLSPSCDLVRGRANSLENVLVADCVPVKDFVDKCEVNLKKLTEKLPSKLSLDQVGGLLVLPEFRQVLPLMAVNLRSLSLISYTEITTNTGTRHEVQPFCRVASMDSPFRERVAWAYLQIAGRPGIPEVDRVALSEAIAKAVTSPVSN